MYKKIGWLILFGLMLVLGACGEVAVQPSKMHTIGVYVTSADLMNRVEGLKEGLRALGYTEGQNITINLLTNLDALTPEARAAALKDFGAKNYDAYWASTGTSGNDLKVAGTTKPIIAAGITDPISRGIVQSLERPGTNLTGVDSFSTELSTDRLKWFAKIKPDTKAVYVMYNPTLKSEVLYLETLKAEAAKLNITLIAKQSTSKAESAKNMSGFKASEASAVMMIGNITINLTIDTVALKELVHREKIAFIGGERAHLNFDALYTLGSDAYQMGRQSATYVDDVYKGANPAEMAIKPATKFEFLLNEKVAKELGLTFPADMVTAADEVLK